MSCTICPRNCETDRIKTIGFCGTYHRPIIAKAAVHFWEEPSISGTRGSGAIFFSGCNLRCVFCQNYEISREPRGNRTENLTALFFEMAEKDVHNINLVTPTHFAPEIAKAIAAAKKAGLTIPFVYNSNSYENRETLRMLDGLIDVYLPDIKYFDDSFAIKYSAARNYFDTAKKAVLEMYRQVGNATFNNAGLIQQGLIIRHLLLPGLRKDTMKILDWIVETIPDVFVSLMRQYFPTYRITMGEFPELNRTLTTFEYQSVVDHFFHIGLKNGYMQDSSAATNNYVPDFSRQS